MSEPTAAEVYAALRRGDEIAVDTWVGSTRGTPVGHRMTLSLDNLPPIEVRVLEVVRRGEGDEARERVRMELADHPRYTPAA